MRPGSFSSSTLLAAAMLAAVGCSPSATSRSEPTQTHHAESALASLRNQIEAVHAERDAAAFANLHTESTIFEWQGRATPLVGRAALEASRLKVWAPRRELRLRNKVSELRIHADRAYEFGSYEETWVAPDGTHVTELARPATASN